jgi:DNA repair exonuclease SbcCD ATPase subunit
MSTVIDFAPHVRVVSEPDNAPMHEVGGWFFNGNKAAAIEDLQTEVARLKNQLATLTEQRNKSSKINSNLQEQLTAESQKNSVLQKKLFAESQKIVDLNMLVEDLSEMNAALTRQKRKEKEEKEQMHKIYNRLAVHVTEIVIKWSHENKNQDQATRIQNYLRMLQSILKYMNIPHDDLRVVEENYTRELEKHREWV